MGAIWMDQEYVDELRRWNVPATFAADWLKNARSSGGYDRLLGIIIHHDAADLNVSLEALEGWAIRNSPNEPIGSGTGTRDRYGPRWHAWAAGATNTAGRGGPLLNSQGEVIALDSGNRVTVNTEWMNVGNGSERWSDQTCDLYVRWCCATLSWINKVRARQGLGPLGAGDIWAHFEYAPTRKVDPFGPCRWNNWTSAKWNMDAFRSEVFGHLLDGPGPLRRYDPILGRVVGSLPPRPAPAVPLPTGPDFAKGEFGLYPLNQNKPNLREGSQGEYVKYAQAVIFHKAGGNIAIDGDFGPQTKQRVMDVQAFFKLEVGGGIGPSTWGLLDVLATPKPAPAPPPPPPPPPPAPAPEPEPEKSTTVGPARLYVRTGWGAWAASQAINGAASVAQLQAENPGTWHPGDRILVPGVAGVETTVKAGEGAFAILRRMHADGADESVSADSFAKRELGRFHAWNGGAERVLRPGDVVCWPVV